MYPKSRHLCIECNQRRAGYLDWRGKFKAATDHPLCVRCYRATMDRARALARFPRADTRAAPERRSGEPASLSPRALSG